MRFGGGAFLLDFRRRTQHQAKIAAPMRTMKVRTPTAMPMMVPFPTPVSELALVVEVVELEEPDTPAAVADALEDDVALVEAVMRCPWLVVDPDEDIDP